MMAACHTLFILSVWNLNNNLYRNCVRRVWLVARSFGRSLSALFSITFQKTWSGNVFSGIRKNLSTGFLWGCGWASSSSSSSAVPSGLFDSWSLLRNFKKTFSFFILFSAATISSFSKLSLRMMHNDCTQTLSHCFSLRPLALTEESVYLLLLLLLLP